VQFIDVSGAMLDSQGKLRRELFGWDPMHMNASGYALWTCRLLSRTDGKIWNALTRVACPCTALTPNPSAFSSATSRLKKTSPSRPDLRIGDASGTVNGGFREDPLDMANARFLPERDIPARETA
jgi:hypothetical protein